jgi:hypothetical protein
VEGQELSNPRTRIQSQSLDTTRSWTIDLTYVCLRVRSLAESESGESRTLEVRSSDAHEEPTESDPRGCFVASTNEHLRNLKKVYPLVLRSVRSVVTMDRNPWTSRIGFETPNGGLEFLRRMKV